MNILSEKIVTTRKKHSCSACFRFFEKGTKMKTQVNVYDGTINTWRTCPTCTEILSKYPSRFEDDYHIIEGGCVAEVKEVGQTPEQLLEYLNKQYYKKLNDGE